MRHGEIANSLSIWSFAATLVALFCSPLGVSAYDGIPRIAFEVEYNIDTAVLMPDGTWACMQNDGQLAGSKQQVDFFPFAESFGQTQPRVTENVWMATMDDPAAHMLDATRVTYLEALKTKLAKLGVPEESLPTKASPARADIGCWERDAKIQYLDFQDKGLKKWSEYDRSEVRDFYGRSWIDDEFHLQEESVKADAFSSADKFAAAALKGSGYRARQRKARTAGVLEVKTKGVIKLEVDSFKRTREYLTNFMNAVTACNDECTPKPSKPSLIRAWNKNCQKKVQQEQASFLAGLNVVRSDHQIPAYYLFRRNCQAGDVQPIETQITMDIRLAHLAPDISGSNAKSAAAKSKFIQEAYFTGMFNVSSALYRKLITGRQVTKVLGALKSEDKKNELKGLLHVFAYWMYRGYGEQKTSISPLPKIRIGEVTAATKASLAINDGDWTALGTELMAACLKEAKSGEWNDYRAYLIGRGFGIENKNTRDLSDQPFNGHAGAFKVKPASERGGFVEMAIEFRPKDQNRRTLSVGIADNTHRFIHQPALADADIKSLVDDLAQDFALAKGASRGKADVERNLAENGEEVETTELPVFYEYDKKTKKCKSDTQPPKLAPELPVGWEQYVDDESGYCYYSNGSGEAQWEFPTVDGLEQED